MPKRGSRGFRWADLAPEHQKAVSHFTASGGTFPYYEPCFEQTEAFSSCLKNNDFEPVMCHKEKMALTACIDTKPMVRLAIFSQLLRAPAHRPQRAWRPGHSCQRELCLLRSH